MSGYAVSNSLATLSALGSTSDVYQTTLPSFLAASRCRFGVWASPAVTRPATSAASVATNAGIERLIGISPGSAGSFGSEGGDQIVQGRRGGETAHRAHYTA